MKKSNYLYSSHDVNPERYSITYFISGQKTSRLLFLQIEGENCVLIDMKNTNKTYDVKVEVKFEGLLSVFCQENKPADQNKLQSAKDALEYYFSNKL